MNNIIKISALAMLCLLMAGSRGRYSSHATTNGSVMTRVDTQSSEIAQVGVEYISPDQHGGFFGTVYRQYHGAKNHGDNITTVGIDKLIAFAGRWNTINCYNGYTDQGANNIRILKSTNKIDIIIIGTMPIQEGWVDYTKN